MEPVDPLTLGWREWLALPALGIGAIKAKLDTGAHSSSLSVVSVETYERGGRLHVRFVVRPRRRGERTVSCEAPVVDRRPVTDSGGHTGERWFIRTGIVLAGRRFEQYRQIGQQATRTHAVKCENGLIRQTPSPTLVRAGRIDESIADNPCAALERRADQS